MTNEQKEKGGQEDQARRCERVMAILKAKTDRGEFKDLSIADWFNEIEKVAESQGGELPQLRKKWLASGEYEDYLLTFGSHKRLKPFVQDVVPRVHGVTYWKLLRTVWEMAEVVTPEQQQWKELMGRAEPHRERFMTKGERKHLESLPEQLTVFRGFGHPGGEIGFSWTLKESVAIKFATLACSGRRLALTNYAGKKPAIAVGSIRKADVLALLKGREEDEIVAMPEAVILKATYPLTTMGFLKRKLKKLFFSQPQS